jgi:hypothetical protein
VFSRAHFFAPAKYFMGFKMETPVFNIIVLWIMTCFLYITLYFDTLKKLIGMRFFQKKRVTTPL